MVESAQHAALVHVAIVDHFFEITHRCAGDPMLLRLAYRLVASERRCPSGYGIVDVVDILGARRIAPDLRIFQ